MKARLLIPPIKFLDFNRGLRNLPFPMSTENILMPPQGAVRLREMPKEPAINSAYGEEKHTVNRRYIEARGVEEVHTELIYKQFGLAAVTGGFILPKNFEYLMKRINSNLRKNQFAIWRVDPPWLPRTVRQAGKKLGGGKPGVKYYVTPVRAKRIILEVGGAIDEYEANAYLEYVCRCFSFPVEFISQRILDERKQEEEYIKKYNRNKFNWDTVLKWNMQNCSSFLSEYDITWKCKYK